MILECGLIGLVGYGCYLYKTMDKRELINDFNKSMEGIGLYNKNKETFLLNNLKKTEYGWMGCIYIPRGLSLEHLNSKKNILEDNLNSIIEIEKDNFKDYINIYIINRDVSKYEFKPVKCKEWELYIGKDFKLNDVKIDMRKNPHILIGGITGSGKSFLIASILTNLIYNSSKKIKIYLLQIAKSELSAFSYCYGVEDAYYTMEDCIDCLNTIKKIIDYRANLFKQYGVRNIKQWNSHYKEEYLEQIYIVIEELSFFVDCPQITDISKVGRSVGVSIIACLQRTTITQMDSTLKSQMSKISFKQHSVLDSNNIIGIGDAFNLKEREVICDINDGYVKAKIPYIDEDYRVLQQYVKEIQIPQKVKKIPKIIENGDIIEPKIVKTNKNFKKQKMLLLEEYKILDVKDEDIREEKPKKNNNKKLKTGIISLEEYRNEFKRT